MSTNSATQKKIICLMGPTASGKTPLAIKLVQHFPLEIISVDSAMVYRSMNIGTAKPSVDELRLAPHHLIDILDPKETYSAGQFCTDALYEIDNIIARGKIPLLVGGTMLYFRVLQQGMAKLPKADMRIRAELQAHAEREGREALHALLATVDPLAAKRINPHDSQRIQRALEVYRLTHKTISTWQIEQPRPLTDYQFYNIALIPSDRARLHERIAMRFAHMLQLGFIDEVRCLYQRDDLSCDLPSIRSVGYRQVWNYLAGLSTYEVMCDQAVAATRQLAKRQLTWLRSWSEIIPLEADAADVFSQVVKQLSSIVF
ncbi:MAG: tRNA (adenosine(37)-N6)-dimethylallyltransferase MiaA [Gammaproteobacteria bacterium]|nr:tRNA (adenosine(37)-N6)-dimethylallyltransferase MiaA [Gammaproteobacteria bacterium]MCW5583466.1 tRNA (adenosine(37)-N6)-dimethylallyltransferase MiaA [Gammaproteobacteria bacterium]